MLWSVRDGGNTVAKVEVFEAVTRERKRFGKRSLSTQEVDCALHELERMGCIKSSVNDRDVGGYESGFESRTPEGTVRVNTQVRLAAAGSRQARPAHARATSALREKQTRIRVDGETPELDDLERSPRSCGWLLLSRPSVAARVFAWQAAAR